MWQKIIKNSDQTDIINRHSWDKEQWQQYFRDRLYDMKAKREPFETQWRILDNTRNTVSFYDNTWELQVSIPLEKTLIEIYEWRTRGKINYDIRPDGQADIDELQPTKYTMKYHLDWDEKDNFWDENKKLKSWKAHYGNAFWFTGIRNYREYRYRQKEDADIQAWTDILNKNNFEEYTHEQWFFFPKAVHPQDFYIDDNALWNANAQYAEDCIMKERVKLVELYLRFKDVKGIDQEELDLVDYRVDPEPKNNQDRSIDHQEVILYYYFNRITKTYMIVANEEHVLYNGYYFYDDGKLPIVNVQHYYDPNSFYTDGISGRVSYLKAYKSEVFQNILTWSAMASGVNLIVWNDEQIGKDWNVWGRQLNLWRTTWWAENVTPVSTSTNLGFFTTVMELIDKETAIVSGINPSEQITATSDVLWIVEINEANKAVRTWSVDEAYDLALDDALSMMLDRLKQFATSLTVETIKNNKWDVVKVIYPKITVKDFTVEKEKGKYIFTENRGKYWYFELKPWILNWAWVKVVTSSTSSVLPIIERRRIQEYIDNRLKLAQIAQLDQTWEMMKKLIADTNFDQIIDWLNDAYDYDPTNLKSNSEKDKIRKEQLKKLDTLKEALTINQWQNVWQTTGETTPLGAWQAWPQNQMATPWGEANLWGTPEWNLWLGG